MHLPPLVPNQIFSSCTTSFKTYFTSSSLHLIYIYALINPVCLVKIHGEEMPGDVESIGAEGGVADMDEIEEIRQLTLPLDVEQDTGIAEVTNDLCKL